jgi:hypothetical protein
VLFLNNSLFDCLEDRPGPVPGTQLGEDIGNVVLDGPLKEIKSAGDLAIAVTSRHQADDFGFPFLWRFARVTEPAVPLSAVGMLERSRCGAFDRE